MKKLSNKEYKLYPIIVFAGLVMIWEFVVVAGIVERFMLPSPTDIVKTLASEFPILAGHTVVTLFEALSGLVIGVVLGSVAALLMDRFPRFKASVYPLIILTQTVPTVAIAPLLVLWLGYEMMPKIVLITLTTFFPIAIGLYGGFQSVDKDYVDLLKSMNAREVDVYKYLKIPSALPEFFSGIRISTAYALVAAVISEWLGGFSGLGVYMTRVRKSYSFDKMFAVIIVISVLSLLMMKFVNILERKIIIREEEDEN